jgi:hypothetical protein
VFAASKRFVASVERMMKTSFGQSAVGDLLIQQGKSKDRWEVIHGIHVCPINRGIWRLYRNREDDFVREVFRQQGRTASAL